MNIYKTITCAAHFAFYFIIYDNKKDLTLFVISILIKLIQENVIKLASLA